MKNFTFRHIRHILFFSVIMLIGTAFAQRPEIHGHRGARGHLPENTIPSFIKALELGAEWLELDLVVTRDRQLLISHEPHFNPKICSYNNKRITSETQKNIYQLTYQEIKAYDCGQMGNTAFPEQQKLASHKPLFTEMIQALEHYAKNRASHLPFYNIEIKSEPKEYDVSQPQPTVFAKMVYETIQQEGILTRSMIQSFDPAILNALYAIDPSLKLGLLVANVKGFEKNMRRLVFTQLYAYNPYYKLVSKKLLKAAHDKKIKVIPWTINEENTMLKLLQMGVDGIISDYPDRVQKARAKFMNP